MRRAFPWVLLGVLGAAVLVGAGASRSMTDLGRFQVIPVWEEVGRTGERSFAYGPMLLDTADGQAWRLQLSEKEEVNWYPIKRFDKTPK